jgi:hypothetical protein
VRGGERRALLLLAVLYLLLSVGYTLATPYGEAPDEPAHVRFIEYMVRFGKLPPIEKDAYSYEAWQPPLYYILGAGLVLAGKAVSGRLGVDEPLAQPLRGNLAARTSTNPKAMFYLHPPEVRWPPWPYLLRALSILMGLGCVLLTYATARTLLPSPASPVVPLLAAGFAAFIPQATYIHATVSNEVLADLTASWVIFLLVAHLLKPYSRTRVVWLGVAFGLGLLSKFSVAPFGLLLAWALWVRSRGSVRTLVRDGLIVASAVLLVSGWLYAYQWLAYGDPLLYSASHAMLPQGVGFHIEELFWLQDPFRWFVWSSYWGVFGWQRAWMPLWTYPVFLAMVLLAVAGGVYLVARKLLSRGQMEACAIMLGALMLSYAVVVFVSTYQIVWQGREMYTSLSGVCVLMALGLGAVFGGRAALFPVRGERASRRLVVGGAATMVLLIALNLYALLGVVYPQLSLGL